MYISVWSNVNLCLQNSISRCKTTPQMYVCLNIGPFSKHKTYPRSFHDDAVILTCFIGEALKNVWVCIAVCVWASWCWNMAALQGETYSNQEIHHHMWKSFMWFYWCYVTIQWNMEHDDFHRYPYSLWKVLLKDLSECKKALDSLHNERSLELSGNGKWKIACSDRFPVKTLIL